MINESAHILFLFLVCKGKMTHITERENNYRQIYANKK